MKHHGVRLTVALLTFSVGVAATWAYLEVARPAVGSEKSAPMNAVEIRLKRSYRGDYGRVIAELEVVNVGDETLYFRGYSEDDNQYYSVRRGDESKSYTPSCGTGLAERTLHPRERATFHVTVGREAGHMRVGFDFLVGKNRLRETLWSDDLYVP
jgi:hypothetical protein